MAGMSTTHPITLYGIPNCDTVKKARAWLVEHKVAHQFYDFKKQGVPQPDIDLWLAAVGWEKLLNRKGTMWRNLAPAQQAAVTDAASARTLMLEVPSVIKRPVMAWGGGSYTVGFDAAVWAARLPA